ncbi:MAG: SGNH/GDSL hydrolase family protein [Mangrovibacterium sp.]
MRKTCLLKLLMFGYILQGSFCANASEPAGSTAPTVIMYRKILGNKEVYPEIRLNDVDAEYHTDGLYITGKNKLVRLDKFYALGERLVRYHVKFSDDAVAVFQSHTGDFKACVDISGRTISINTKPEVTKTVAFINPDHEYIVEIVHVYQKAKIRIADLFTGQSDELEVILDGTGGCGAGAVQTGFQVGLQWDYYCFGLQAGTSMLVKQICVQSLKRGLTLLIYGDSISQPEGYFPTNDYPESWTQLIMKHVKGEVVSSGRGGGRIEMLMEYIKNELPFIKAKYVMVTIGTNGGNTEENLSELVEYILSQGSVPILNNIPCNESGTQTEINLMIEKIRQKYHINGCKFDLATSLSHDGKEVDKSTMWYEDYSSTYGWHIYHHPNVKGSLLMFTRTLIDIPEIYE